MHWTVKYLFSVLYFLDSVIHETTVVEGKCMQAATCRPFLENRCMIKMLIANMEVG